MKPTNRRIGALFGGGVACVAIAYWGARSFWLHRTAVTIPVLPEAEVMQTGTISTTNGWEFKIVNVLSFGRRNVRHMEFCARTRQIFVAFGDRKDDSIFQWDVDTGRLVHTFQLGKGFISYDYSISPDGRFLIAERVKIEPVVGHVPEQGTLFIDVQNGRVLRDLGDIGCWASWQDEVRFGADGRSVWLGARSLENWDRGVAFALDGTSIQNPSKNDFPSLERKNLWAVPFSKSNLTNDGLFCRASSGVTNLITRDYWWRNYAITKDGGVVLVATWHDDITLWDTAASKQVARQRITNHHNGAGYVVYDEARDRFLIADPSWRGVKHLRALVITRRPAAASGQEANRTIGGVLGANKAPAPNRRPRFPFAALFPLDCSLALTILPGGLGEARRSATRGV